MRCILKYDHAKRLLTVFAHQAPHRREHRETLKRYRAAIWEAAQAIGLTEPITHNINLSVTFIDPNGPDLDNLIVALFQALDGKCGQGPTLLKDDRQIVFIERAGILYP